jgi:hypothetical protein
MMEWTPRGTSFDQEPISKHQAISYHPQLCMGRPSRCTNSLIIPFNISLAPGMDALIPIMATLMRCWETPRICLITQCCLTRWAATAITTASCNRAPFLRGSPLIKDRALHPPSPTCTEVLATKDFQKIMECLNPTSRCTDSIPESAVTLTKSRGQPSRNCAPRLNGNDLNRLLICEQFSECQVAKLTGHSSR